ncbi:MAG: hypothetical protein ABIO45_12095 [Burkholderiaceae bacterium]
MNSRMVRGANSDLTSQTDQPDIGTAGNFDHRREGFDGVVRRALHRRGRDRQVAGDAEQQRVAVRRRARHRGGGDGAGRAGPIFDDDRLAKPVREPEGDLAQRSIGSAAGRQSQDDAHRPSGIGSLRRRRRWLCRDRRDRYRGEEDPAQRFRVHGECS